MAGGIDWFRWHHGTVSDQKFGLVAKKAGASVAEVIAVWACLLEAASTSEDRGNPGAPDFEAMDFALGMDDGKAQRIYERLRERDVIDADSGRLTSWEKRQPKRERPEDNSTERSRNHRAKQRQASPEVEDETPCNATQHQETPREEKRREDLSLSDSDQSAAFAACGAALKRAGVNLASINTSDPVYRELVKQGMTADELEAVAKEAVEKSIKKPLPWICAVIQDRRTRAATVKLAPKPGQTEDRMAKFAGAL